MTRKEVARFGPLTPALHYEVEELRRGTWHTILDFPADYTKRATKKTWIEYQEAARFAREWSERNRTVATRVVEVKD